MKAMYFLRKASVSLLLTSLFLSTGSYSLAGIAGTVPDNIGILPAGQFVAPKAVPGQSSWLNVQQVRQEMNLCVPTSSSMVLNFYGVTDSPREIKTWSRGNEFDSSQVFNDFTITYFVDLIFGLKKHGIFWTIPNYSNDDVGFNSGFTDLMNEIDNSRPVLVDTILFGGHTLVVAGYRNAGSSILMVDPNIGSPGLREVIASDFKKIWNSNLVGSNRRAAVFTQKPERTQ